MSVFEADHEAFREAVRDFLAGEVVPAFTASSTGALPPAVHARAAAQGLGTVGIPSEFGGGGVDDPRFDAVVAHECLRLGLTGFAVSRARLAEAARWLTRHGPAELRERLLPGLADGALRATVAAGDPEDLLDVPAGAVADVVVVDLGRDAAGADRGVAVLDTAAPGCRVAAVEALGARGVEGADLRVAAVGEGHPHAAELRRMRFRSAAVLAVAGAQAALDATIAYVNERRVFSTPVAAFGNTRTRLAGLAAELAAARALHDVLLGDEAAGDASPGQAALAALRAVAVHDAAVDLGLQLHGGYGYMREYPISAAFADARYLHLHADLDAMVDEVAPAVGLVGVPQTT